MAVMRKSYALLCVVGLCTTLFVIHITYGDSTRPVTPSNNIRGRKLINNSTRRLTFNGNKFERFSPTGSQSDEYSNFSEKLNNSIKNFNELQFPERTPQLSNQNVDVVNQNILYPRVMQNSNENEENSNFFDISNKPPVKTENQGVDDLVNSKAPKRTITDAKNNPPPPPHLVDSQQMINDFINFKKGMQFQDIKLNGDVSKNQPALPEVELRIPVEPVKPVVNVDVKLPVPDISSCKPKDNIALLKTHKCSSSTMQNILYRWGDNKNLSFVLPKGSMPYLGNPALFNKKYAIESPDGVYNILANHARFSNEGIAELLPPDTTYITILRNPTTQYESLFTYYKHENRYGADLAKFVANPAYYFHHEPMTTHIVGRNSMLFDLGLDARYLEGSSGRVSRWIQMLDKKFKLVLIAEYFAESLILLKDILCWKMEDIVYLNQNARSASSKRKLTRSMEQGIKRWNSADTNLYNHFNQTLWRKIEAYGMERMIKDVALLNAKNEELKKDCVASTLKFGDPRMWYPPGVNMESFKMNPNAKDKLLCDRVTRPELTYMKYLADRERKRNIGPQKS